MTLSLDTTALLAVHLVGPARDRLVEALTADDDWCASSLALAEALAAVDHLADTDAQRDELHGALYDLWSQLAVVPVDQLCLEVAADLAQTQPLRMSAAIHLAAATRLPAPRAYATFDPAQIPVALALGFDVVSL